MKFRPLVVANWKMNPGTPEDAKKLFSKVKRVSKELKKTDIVVAAPFVYIPLLKTDRPVRKNTPIKLALGAQDAYYMESGAHTGEVSSSMLASSGVSYVILGHSERRAMGETNALVNQKLKAVIGSGMKAVVCIGEQTRDRDGEYLSFLRTQINETFADLSGRDLADIVIAYEPVWAIGTAAKGAMAPSELHETTLYIQKVLAEVFTRDLANSVPILYGGSVDEGNAPSLIQNGNVKGFLVGRASLAIETFLPILKAAEHIK